MNKAKVKRTFLNRKDGMAALMVRTYNAEPYHEREDAWGGSADCHLTISDCGRQITLDFDAYDEQDTKDRLAKIDKIRAALDLIEGALIEHYISNGCLTRKERDAVRMSRKDDKAGDDVRTISIDELEDLDDL